MVVELLNERKSLGHQKAASLSSLANSIDFVFNCEREQINACAPTRTRTFSSLGTTNSPHHMEVSLFMDSTQFHFLCSFQECIVCKSNVHSQQYKKLSRY